MPRLDVADLDKSFDMPHIPVRGDAHVLPYP